MNKKKGNYKLLAEKKKSHGQRKALQVKAYKKDKVSIDIQYSLFFLDSPIFHIEKNVTTTNSTAVPSIMNFRVMLES
jgi:hypothetical protein